MAGKITHTIVGLLLITYLLCLIIFFFMHENIRLTVNRLNYEVAEVISTTAVFSKELFTYLSERIQRFGEYKISLRLDKQVKSGIYDTFFNKDDIIDKPLRVGDKLTIYIEGTEPTLFGRLISAGILGSNRQYQDMCIKSMYTAVISKNSTDVVKGYDVIANIKDNEGNDTIAILVITKLNPAGKYYGLESHDYVEEDNPYYGDSEDERGNTGINYILDVGDFKREFEFDSSGSIKLIKFIQL